MRRFSVGMIIACLSVALTTVQAKEEAPEGYEDAPQADAKPVTPARARGAAVQPRPVPAVVAPPPALPADKNSADENVNPHVLQLEKQFRPQFDQMLRIEIAFARRACNMDDAQRGAVAKAGEKCVSSVLRQCAIAQHKMETGGFQSDSMPNATRLLREQLGEVVKKTLRPEQVEQYRRESQKRTANLKRAVIRYMVSKADQTLSLSVEQRDKLVLALSKDYSDSWEQSLPLWLHNPHLVPLVPDAQILPLLNETQAAIWRETPKNNHVFGQMWMMQLGVATIQEP